MAEWLTPSHIEGLPLASEEVRPGSRLGRYEILAPVASGGMARVWAARMHGQRGFSKLVAIKTILPHLAEDQDFERMFLDEAHIASGIQHPNVCEIYELGEEGHVLYLVMEWLSGDSLFAILDPHRQDDPDAEFDATGTVQPMDPRIAARIIAEAAAGLHAAHELESDKGEKLQVVHRDVSPQNILITLDGHVKVTDFGVAKAIGQLHDQSAVGQMRGKVLYAPPEYISGRSVDRRGDVYSLGCVFYECVTGKKAFGAAAEHLVMRRVVAGDYVPPSAAAEGVPAALDELIGRALANSPADRYPSADAMRDAIENWLASGQGKPVTNADVARLVRSRIGEQAEARREQLKRAMARFVDSDPAPSTPRLEAGRPPPAARSGSTLVTGMVPEVLNRPSGRVERDTAVSPVHTVDAMQPMHPMHSMDEVDNRPTVIDDRSTPPGSMNQEAVSVSVPRPLLPTYEDDYESEMPTIPFRTHRDGMVTGAVRKLRSLQASWAGRLGMFFGIAAVTLAAASLATILPRIRRGPRERVGHSPPLVAAEAPMMNPAPAAGGSGDPPGNGPSTVPSTVPPTVPTAPVAEQQAPSPSAQPVELGDTIEIPSEASNPPNATAGKENVENTALSPSPTPAPSPGSIPGQSQAQGSGQSQSQSQGDSRRAHGTKALSEDPEVNEIVLRTVPKSATVTVDGVAVTGRTRRIPRPRVGRVVRVDIRAEGYEDEVIFVDDGSVSPMTVLLSARANEGASARRRERSKDTIEDAGRGVAEENAAGD